MGKRDEEWFHKALYSLAHSEKDRNRFYALKRLIKLKDPRSIDVLIKALQNDSFVQVRSKAAEALGKFNDDRCNIALLNALNEDEKWSVRANAAQAISEIDDKDLLEPLKETLDFEEHKTVINEILRSVARIGGPSEDEFLIKYYKDHNEFSGALTALRETKSETGKQFMLEILEKKTNKKWLYTQDCIILETIAKYYPDDVIDKLIEMYKIKPSWTSAKLLAEIGGDRIEEFFIDCMKSPDEDTRYNVSYQIPKVISEKSKNKIVELLFDNLESGVSTRSSVQSLLKIGDDSIIQRIGKIILESNNRTILDAIFSEIKSSSYKSFVPYLIKIIERNIGGVIEEEAAEALASLEDERAKESLLKYITRGGKLGYYLRKINGTNRLVAQLISSFNSNNIFQIKESARELMKIDDEEVKNFFFNIVDEHVNGTPNKNRVHYPTRVIASIDAMGVYKFKKATNILIKIVELAEANAYVEEAIQALKEIGDPKAIEPIRKALNINQYSVLWEPDS